MAWTSMHFAVGMGCAGGAWTLGCIVVRRGWRWLGAAMTLGGVWAIGPDLPRIWREDFPSLPLASVLGSPNLERSLHRMGDLFFFHTSLDRQPNEYALHGLVLILLFYNLAVGLLMLMEWRQRNSIGNRAWRAELRHRAAREGRYERRRSSGDPSNPHLPTGRERRRVRSHQSRCSSHRSTSTYQQPKSDQPLGGEAEQTG